MKRNVLIFSGGAYPAIQIYYCLQYNLLFNPIAASSYADHAQFVYKKSYSELPYIQEENFIEEFNILLEKENIEFVIPTHDTIVLFLMQHSKEINAKIVSSPYETALLCRYKSKTYEKLKAFEFVPKVYHSVCDVDCFPVFLKKDDDQGSRNAFCVGDEEQLRQIYNAYSDMIICEYLPGEEVTIDCFTDRHGKLLFSNSRTRDRVMNGISARSSNFNMTTELKHIVDVLNAEIIFRGYWFVQLKKDANGNFKLLEICTRFAGTFGLSKSLDVNLPLLALCDFSDMDVSITPNDYLVTADKCYIDRYHIDIEYDLVYFDFDDTLVFDRKTYNTFAMQFLYQCLNKGKKIVLITKHEYDIQMTMRDLHFDKGLFAEIIEVPLDRKKYEFMDKKSKAIFIDNAYAERKAVKENLANVYTFDVANIDCLIDWS